MTNSQSKIGFLFPGQGAQFVGMGKDLFEKSLSAREVFNKADQLLGYSIQKICFEGPESDLMRTHYAQPAIFVASFAALATLKEKCPDLQASFSAGLSLGEFTALVAAGSLNFEDGLKLVQRRAEAMEKSAQNHPGTMASVMGLSQAGCEAVAAEAGCEVANLNAPDQIVLSGTVEAIEKACEIAEKQGAKRAIRLKVGGAFHSSLMKDAKEDLEKALAETTIREPQCLFVPNAAAIPTSTPDEIRQLLATQLMSPVRWVETMQCAVDQKVLQFLEIGPGKVLKGLARRCNRELSVSPCGTAEEIESLKNEQIKA